MQKPNVFRVKRLILELLFDFDSGVVRHLWDILDEFKISGLQARVDGLGLIAEDAERNMVIRIDGKRAAIDFENIDRIEAAQTTVGRFVGAVLKYRKQSKFARIGVRTYIMALTDPNASKKEYIDALANLLPCKSLKVEEATDAGFFVRFPKNGWGIRLGTFAYDETVMQRHHRVNNNPVYAQPSLVYDLDFSRVEYTPDNSFDTVFLLREVHNMGVEVMKTHLDEIWGQK